MAKVTVVPYDPRWPKIFEGEARAITAAMGDNLTVIHHIGSTSIPGIYAKPVIDMLAVVTDVERLDQSSQLMRSLGYEVMGEFGIPGRRYFRRDNTAGERTHQIHAFEVGSPHLARHIAFRDFMRAHPTIARQYSDLKQSLAAAHPTDIEAYMDGKDPFIKEIQTKAIAWASAIELTPDSVRRPS